MKKIKISAAFILSLFALELSAQNLLIHYDFNHSDTATTQALDSSGNNRHARITNWVGSAQVAAPLQTAVGVSGQPGDFSFDNSSAPAMGGFDRRGGTVQWIGFGKNGAIQSLSALTLTYWFKTPPGVVAGNAARAVSIYGADNIDFFENRFATEGGVGGFAQSVVTGNSLRTSGSAAYGQSDTWTFVAITFDGAADEAERIRMYVGGLDTPVTLVETSSSRLTTLDLGRAKNSLTLAGYQTGSGQTPFQAIIDDFRLYGSGDDSSEGALDLSRLETVRMSALKVRK
jgi:hypothetical protein